MLRSGLLERAHASLAVRHRCNTSVWQRFARGAGGPRRVVFDCTPFFDFVQAVLACEEV
jgi:hypothetical protein